MITSFVPSIPLNRLVHPILTFAQYVVREKTDSLPLFLLRYRAFAQRTLLFFFSHGDLINDRQGRMDLVPLNRLLQSTLANL